MDLHGNDIEYVDAPGPSPSGHQDFQQYDGTEDHASSLAPQIPEGYDNSQIVIDNQENVPTTTIKVSGIAINVAYFTQCSNKEF